MMSEVLERGLRARTTYLGPPFSIQTPTTLVSRQDTRDSFGRIGSPQNRLKESNIMAIYEKVAEIKNTVKSIADKSLTAWPHNSQEFHLGHSQKNTLHSYVEQEREAMKLIGTKQFAPAYSGFGRF
jgi:hypothetical protein